MKKLQLLLTLAAIAFAWYRWKNPTRSVEITEIDLPDPVSELEVDYFVDGKTSAPASISLADSYPSGTLDSSIPVKSAPVLEQVQSDSTINSAPIIPVKDQKDISLLEIAANDLKKKTLNQPAKVKSC